MLAGMAIGALFGGALFGGVAQAAGGDGVRLNQIQVIGTHNSYHAGLTPGVAKMLQAANPKAFDSLDYQHSPLTVQFDKGIRQIELDVFSDAEGGRFAHPFGATLNAGGAAAYDPEHIFAKPGFKVLHVQDIDYVSTCQPFVGCLKEIRAWSKAHPDHVPLFVLVETKTDKPIPAVPNMASPEPFTPAVMDALDAEIRSVFQPGEVITPDDVRGKYATLPEAVAHGGWPTLKAARGKIVFLLDQRNVTAAYLEGHPALKGRMIFTNAKAGDPDAAFVEHNEADPAEIAALVKAGYLVRTRSDADTKEGRDGDTATRDKALASGAQMVSTDYPWFEPARWTGYTAALPGKASVRCNPVNAPKACSDAALKDTPVKP
ncbi:MAG: phosphatidylinositol-specific phospholipase C1-like protein [Proteobacteria bacterium]|nr:phosphatidylinositol-specific phospholipase C1-like protein [Pseudomonadota bacterium]